MSEINYVITNDKWAREPGGIIDADDMKIIKAMGPGSQVISSSQLMDVLAKDSPGKFKELHAEFEKRVGKKLSLEDLKEYLMRGQEPDADFYFLAGDLTFGQAGKVRHWRVDEHRSWRSLAREAFTSIVRGHEGWDNLRKTDNPPWSPPSSQIAGLGLCKRAAALFKEDYLNPPWN
jgi:hypothetical protein